MTRFKATQLSLSFLIGLSTIAVADQFEADIDNAIRTACHGNLVDPDDSDFFKFFDFNSPLCKDVRVKGDEFDFVAARKQYPGKLTQVDLDRIFDPNYLQRAAPSKIEQECTYNVIGGPVGVDTNCLTTRQQLADNNITMSLREYLRIEKSCNNHQDCINNWQEKWQKGDRALPPKPKVGSIGFDDLVSAPNLKPAAVNTATVMSFDDLMGENQKPTSPASTVSLIGPATTASSADSGETGFDNIYTSRDTIRINGIKQNLFDKNEVIASRCQCAFNQTSCFTSDQYDYSQLNEVMSKTDANYESEMDQVCMTWYSNLKGRTSDDEGLLNRYLANSDIILGNISKLNNNYNKTKSKLDDKDYEITANIERQRQQQEQQNSSGFNWGKFGALGLGLGIGGAMGDLGGSEMMNLMGRAAMDSMDGVEGVDNLNMGVTELNQIYDEHYDAMANIQQQSDAMNAANLAKHQANSAPIQQAPQQQQSAYDDLLADNAPEETSPEDAQQDNSAAVGAYISSGHWKTCVVLDAGGGAHYKAQTLADWNNPHSGYTWNQPARSGTWSMSGDRVTVDVSGDEVNPTTGERSPKQHNFTVTLTGNVLGDATKVGQGIGACR
jgi:hypothetical protein